MGRMTTAKLSRNDPCHCGSGKKYKKCHLESDESEARAERAEAKAADDAIIARVELESKPLGPRYWALAGLGVAVAVGVGVMKGASGGIIVAAAWLLGMVAWAVIRDPPPPREDAGNPAALDFGQAQNQQTRQQSEQVAAAERRAQELAQRGTRRQRRQRPR